MHYSDWTPTTEPEVQTKLRLWFQSNSEILVRTRRRCGGTEEFEFFSSFEALTQRMREESTYTWFTVFQNPQLPIRGIVDEAFIARCCNSIPDGRDYLITETVRTVAGKHAWFHNASGNSAAMLRDELEDSRGVPVAVGLYPPCLEERDDVIHAFTPDADGTVKPGPY